MSLRRKQLGGNIDCRKIYRTFWHSSVGNGSLAVAGYTISVFNWERRFRVSLKSDRGRKDMVAVRHAIKIYTDGSKMEDGVVAWIYCSEFPPAGRSKNLPAVRHACRKRRLKDKFIMTVILPCLEISA